MSEEQRARVWAPVQRFLKLDIASGVILFVAAVIAIAWANSPWREGYTSLWQITGGAALPGWSFEKDLHFWINDGLMTIFFLAVGLEIRREIHSGELSVRKRAALPVGAALGGMIVPACIYLLLNAGHEGVRGWGVPVATDIAFAVAVFALLGTRVPHSLRILLLTLAIVDDVGAILVIAIFYSAGVDVTGFAVIGLGVAITLAMQALKVRSPWAYVPAGIITWAGAYLAGIHPTLMGVLLGMITPVRPSPGFLVAPVDQVRLSLNRWVIFGILPLFAFANAGVTIGDVSLEGDALLVFLGVAIGLVVGKPIGIVAMSWLWVRAGWAEMPSGTSWAKVGIVGLAGGVGFTMSMFIAELAFPRGVLLDTAKLAIMAASTIAAVLAFAAGRKMLSNP